MRGRTCWRYPPALLARCWRNARIRRLRWIPKRLPEPPKPHLPLQWHHDPPQVRWTLCPQHILCLAKVELCRCRVSASHLPLPFFTPLRLSQTLESIARWWFWRHRPLNRPSLRCPNLLLLLLRLPSLLLLLPLPYLLLLVPIASASLRLPKLVSILAPIQRRLLPQLHRQI